MKAFLIPILLIALFPVSSTCAQVAVVVSIQSPINNLTSNQVADIFLGRPLLVPQLREVVPFDLSEESATRQEFYEKLTRKKPPQIRAHWMKLIFTGKGEPPFQLADADAVKRTLATNPNAIAYLPANRVDASVRTLLLIE